jgi:hypothetical protein
MTEDLLAARVKAMEARMRGASGIPAADQQPDPTDPLAARARAVQARLAEEHAKRHQGPSVTGPSPADKPK